MKKIPTFVLVVAVALFDVGGRVLLQQRLPGKRHGGLWEFPGGKVENRESPRDALTRELAEELALSLDPNLLEPAFFAEETGEPGIVLNLYTSRQALGDPEAQEGQAFGWFTLAEAAQLPLAPMDSELLKRLAQ